jgi:DNA-binding CsgD family transcriptional regulator
VAIHLLATDPAGDPAVVEMLSAAAGRALDRRAPDTAIAYLRRALEEPPDAAARPALLRQLIAASYRAMDPGGFENLLGSGTFEELTADSRTLRELADQLAFALWGRGRLGDASALLERATSAAVEAQDYDVVARFQYFVVLWSDAPAAEARARLDRYKDQIAPDTPGQRVWLALQAFCGLLGGEARATVSALARRALEDGKIWNEQPDSTAIPGGSSWVLLQVDELDAAEPTIDQNLSAALARGAAAPIAGATSLRAELAYLRGEVAQAEADARAAVETSRQGGFHLIFPHWIALLVAILIERDDLAAAESEFSTAEMTGTIPDHWSFGPLRFSRSSLRLAQGRPREALEDMLASGGALAKAGLQAPYSAGGSYLALDLLGLGDRAQAREVAEQELEGARAWGQPRRTGIALRTLGLIEGDEAGLERLREALAVLEPSPARLEYARTLTDYGAALRRTNRRAEAREPLREALDWARRAGALAIAKRAHAELEATGEKLGPVLAAGVQSLTPSERRIAGLAADGLTNRQIAQNLFLSVKTVESHLRGAYRKLDIGSRGELGPALKPSSGPS